MASRPLGDRPRVCVTSRDCVGMRGSQRAPSPPTPLHLPGVGREALTASGETQKLGQ